MKLTLLATALALTLTACDPVIQKEYIQVELNRPPHPTFRPVSNTELACLSLDTYQKLVDQVMSIEDYVKKTDAIIDCTHKEVLASDLCRPPKPKQ